MRKSTQLAIAAILLITVGISLVVVGATHSEATNEYEVKLEQVEDGRHIDFDEVVQIDDMSESEQNVLYEAFKEVDHFFGSAEVEFQTDDTASFDAPFTLVEHAGVTLLVAVDGPERVNDMTNFGAFISFIGILLVAFSVVVGLMSFEQRDEERRQKRRRERRDRLDLFDT